MSMSMLCVVASYTSVFKWRGESVRSMEGGASAGALASAGASAGNTLLTCAEMLSHMLKPFSSLSSSLTSSAASGSKEDRRLAGKESSAATRSATAVLPLCAASLCGNQILTARSS